MVSSSVVISEMREVKKDLESFREARRILLSRVEEMSPERQETFLSWAASQVIFNALILAIVRCEGLIEDYTNHLNSLDIPDNVVELKR